ncbi:MAG TPA: hypothetical protein DCG75_04540 [Bacteroidales bacterium]|nr:hypothetical protein [Bacteroidales bacterium]
MENFHYTLIGYLNSARFLAYELEQPTMAKDLLKYEVIEPEFCTLKKLKFIAKNEGIELEKVWRENYTIRNKRIKIIYNYNISERLKNILNHQKIVSIDELSNYTQKQALNFRNAGKKSIEELEQLMFKHGVQFKNTDQ